MGRPDLILEGVKAVHVFVLKGRFTANFQEKQMDTLIKKQMEPSTRFLPHV